ncbi:hypothetical protein BKA65DRAFT_23918 [Rhexocercosporidium sp. MPI-PUGE-AT-0058]|nr:hypothetical protein BKA65DRAFT_23918 [Rhexocercosporidium sp. MPI-PUGE-AT-0058]
MAGFVGEIPGMYYDQEKKKYFKIQASSAGPASTAYSSQDVKRRKLRDEKAAEAARDKERRNRRIQQSNVLTQPLVGGALQREYGNDGFEPARILAGGLVRQGHVLLDEEQAENGSGTFTIIHRLEVSPAVIDFRVVTNGLIECSRFDLERRDLSSQNFQFSPDKFSMEMIPERPNSSDITSACVHETNRLQATTWLSNFSTGGIMINDTTSIHDVDDIDDDTDNRRTVSIGPGHTRGQHVYIFSSTAAPPASNTLFAFGTSAGVLCTDKHGAYNTTFVTPDPGKRPDDIFAVEFLSDTPSVLLSGGRRGILNITDLRLPMPPCDNDTITHPSSITHIRQLDQHRLIVSGLNSSLCQYDLRFRRTDPSSTGPTPRAPKIRQNKKPTRPILTYPAYHNTASHQAGFDIDLEAGIVAAAQESDEFHPSVQLFSLHGGHKLDSPHAFGFQYKNDATWLVKCLRFARDTDSGMKSLYVGQRPVVQRYAWGEHDPEQVSYGSPVSVESSPRSAG